MLQLQAIYYIRNVDGKRGCYSRDGFYRSKEFSDADRRAYETEQSALDSFKHAVELGFTEYEPIEIVKIFITTI